VERKAGRVVDLNKSKGRACLRKSRSSEIPLHPARGDSTSQHRSVARVHHGRQGRFSQNAESLGRFHIVKRRHETINNARKAARKKHEALTGHQCTFLKHPNTLSNGPQQHLAALIRL